MGEDNQSPLHRAAWEARKAAARARDFADLFEKYADRLVTPGCELDASGLRLQAKDKFSELREALSDSDDWARVAEWRDEAKLVASGS
jgi:hypothetical protein